MKTFCYEINQADIVMPSERLLLGQVMRHVLAVRLTEMNPYPPSRLGGIRMLYIVLVLMYEGRVRTPDGGFFKIYEAIVDEAYGEFGGGGDGRWHTDLLRWAKEWPKRGFQQRHLLRVTLWYIFFAATGQPLNLEDHTCDVCAGRN